MIGIRWCGAMPSRRTVVRRTAVGRGLVLARSGPNSRMAGSLRPQGHAAVPGQGRGGTSHLPGTTAGATMATAGCAHIPAHPEQKPPEKAAARVYQVRERYGLIWVSLGPTGSGRAALPGTRRSGLPHSVVRPIRSAQRQRAGIIENFLDVAHLAPRARRHPGDPRYPEIPEYRTETGTEGIIARDIGVYQPNPYGSRGGEHVVYTYRVLRPFMAYLAKDAEGGVRFTRGSVSDPSR